MDALRRTGVALAMGVLLACSARASGGEAANPPSPGPPDWAGTWRGSLTNVPGRADLPAVTVTVELGPFPGRDGACSMWRSTYEQEGKVAGVKDYRLCRGSGADDLYVDEGDVAEGKQVKLSARWLGDRLVSAFKLQGLALFTVTRLRGDVLEEDIYVMNDSAPEGDVTSMPVRSLQRLELRRAPPPDSAR